MPKDTPTTAEECVARALAMPRATHSDIVAIVKMAFNAAAWTADWQPISTAPQNETIIITDRNHWTLARFVATEVQVLQLRWPFVRYETQWRWFSGGRKLRFEPTHWTRLNLIPPPKG